MSRLTLEGLEVLDAIDRKGSFAAAAAALYRVPSKITYTVNKMEDELGVSLFRKEGRRSVLTPAGQLLMEQGRELLDAAQRLVENTRQVDRGWESSLSIALDTVLEFDYLQTHLQGLFEVQPDLEINIHDEVLGGSWEAIKQGRVDLVIGATSVDGSTQGLVVEELMQIEWVYAVAPTHRLTEIPQPLSREQLLEHRAVVVRDSSRDLPALTLRVFDKQPLLRVASMQQKIDAQRLGYGVGFLPRFRVEHLLQSGELIALDMEDPYPGTPLNMVWKSNNKGKALRWLVDSLRQPPLTIRPPPPLVE
jgi:DNA-binding transcriptional LysR family regulator